MTNESFRKFHLCSVALVILASFYPLYMGLKVGLDMLAHGIVRAADYPKYIIPYTPISLALIIGVIVMPLAMKHAKRFALCAASALSLVIFFVSELLLEKNVLVATMIKEYTSDLGSWQMYTCMATPYNLVPGELTAIELLVGDYNPMFKLHFYVISVILILTLLNCFYGFGKMAASGDRAKLRPLTMQSISSLIFLGLCILACFTAFFRTGRLRVSPISAILMCAFFILIGLTVGIYVGSFLYSRRPLFSIVIPAISASITTVVIYIGELILLHGHLYIFGKGFLFDALPAIVFAPIDIIVIALSGIATAMILKRISVPNE